MKLFHSLSGHETIGTDEAISSDFGFRCSNSGRRRRYRYRRHNAAGFFDPNRGSLVLNKLTVDVNKLPTEDFEDMSFVFSKH